MQENKPTVVLVNDEAHLLRLAATYLEKKGLHVIQAELVDEAIELMKRHEAGGGAVNVVVTDLTLHGSEDGAMFASRIRAGGIIKDPDKVYIILDSGDPYLNIGPIDDCSYDYVFPHGKSFSDGRPPYEHLADLVEQSLARGQSPASDAPKAIIYQPEGVKGEQRLVPMLAKEAGMALIKVSTPEALSGTLLREKEHAKLLIIRPEIHTPLEEIQAGALSILPPTLHILSGAAAEEKANMGLSLVRDERLIETAERDPKRLLREISDAMHCAVCDLGLNEDFEAHRSQAAEEMLANKDGQLDKMRGVAQVGIMGWLEAKGKSNKKGNNSGPGSSSPG